MGLAGFSAGSFAAELDNRVPCATRAPLERGEVQCPVVVWSDPEDAEYIAAKANSGAAQNPIDVPVSRDMNACWYVDNISPTGHSLSFFVPFRSPEEWSSFIASVRSGGEISSLALLVGCARQTLAPVMPSDVCSNPSAEGRSVDDENPATFGLPYKRVQSPSITYPSPMLEKVFKCDGKNLQTVKVYWSADRASGEQPRPSSGWNWPYDGSGWVQHVVEYSPGGCGPANGVATADAPDEDDLCKGAGVVGKGLKRGVPWTWSCQATGTDMKTESVQCSAPLQPTCGTATAKPTETKPTDHLCASGSASGVTSTSDGTKWMWTCTGSSKIYCTVPIAGCTDCEKPGCGPAAGHAVSKAPASGLCASGGSATSVGYVEGAKPYWVWTCRFPGQSFTCTARDCSCD